MSTLKIKRAVALFNSAVSPAYPAFWSMDHMIDRDLASGSNDIHWSTDVMDKLPSNASSSSPYSPQLFITPEVIISGQSGIEAQTVSVIVKSNETQKDSSGATWPLVRECYWLPNATSTTSPDQTDKVDCIGLFAFFVWGFFNLDTNTNKLSKMLRFWDPKPGADSYWLIKCVGNSSAKCFKTNDSDTQLYELTTASGFDTA